jgi:hypothetical protein
LDSWEGICYSTKIGVCNKKRFEIPCIFNISHSNCELIDCTYIKKLKMKLFGSNLNILVEDMNKR